MIKLIKSSSVADFEHSIFSGELQEGIMRHFDAMRRIFGEEALMNEEDVLDFFEFQFENCYVKSYQIKAGESGLAREIHDLILTVFERYKYCMNKEEKTMLRMSFSNFYAQVQSLYELTGCISYDLSSLFYLMVPKMLPEKLPDNYFYDMGEYHKFKNGKYGPLTLHLKKINNNFPDNYVWLDLLEKKFGSFANATDASLELLKKRNESSNDFQKNANLYFIDPLQEIVQQMKQYYQDHGIEEKGFAL